MPKTSVHTRHCCKTCGCKYGEEECPVVNGWQEQEHPCGQQYTCGWDDFADLSYDRDEDWRDWMDDLEEDGWIKVASGDLYINRNIE